MKYCLLLLLDFEEDDAQALVYFDDSEVPDLDVPRACHVARCYCRLVHA
jgi:hypothetical protein